jgi:hypothetical protein
VPQSVTWRCRTMYGESKPECILHATGRSWESVNCRNLEGEAVGHCLTVSKGEYGSQPVVAPPYRQVPFLWRVVAAVYLSRQSVQGRRQFGIPPAPNP